jgi:MoaA/NifB/PqqE/SkfB family radical SAM enzyme
VVLGQFPQLSLREMWHSEALKTLRAYIDHHDLSLGCYKCRESIFSGNYGATTAAGFDFLRAFPACDYPRLMEFELSNTCNLECVMCSGRVSSSIRKNREHKPPLPMRYDASFVAQLEEFIPHLKQARFYGGEPFLIDLYYDIWERMIEMNPRINLYLLTNGTVLNDRIKALLNRGHFTVHVSMDSFNASTYESIRRNARYEETMQHLVFFRDYMQKRQQRLCLYVTPTRINWQDIPEMVNRCDQMEVDIYFSTAYYPEDLSLWNLPIDRLDEILRFYRTSKIKKGHNRQRFNEMVSDLLSWQDRQQDDAHFIENFKVRSADQEYAPLKEPFVLSSANAPEYRRALEQRLNQDASANEDSTTLKMMEEIDQLIREFELNEAVIYHYLSGVEPAIIRDRIRNTPHAENAAFLRQKQTDILKTHELI